MKTEPKWWNDEHTGAWDRVKSAMKRDWEQTKADLSSKGTELNQDASDTIAQAAGKQPIPPGKAPNAAFEDAEESLRYGVGARHQYKDDNNDWSDKVESKLKEEWGDLKSGKTWDEVKGAVRRGWDRAKS